MSHISYVVYHRVSTKKQGESGLGLDAQRRDVELYLSSYSGQPFKVIHEVTDILSGKGGLSERPELKECVELCERTGAVLLVAKLDRLSRDVELIAHLIKRVKLRVACMPYADNFQLHLYAALAEQEREFISKRTIAALKSAKAQGVKLGGLRAGTEARNKGLQEKAARDAEPLRAQIVDMQSEGLSLRAMAAKLNLWKVATVTGKGEWQASQVKRVIDRLGL